MSTAAYTAVPLDHNDNDYKDDKTTPLLLVDEQQPPSNNNNNNNTSSLMLVNTTILSQFKTCSMCLGLFLGFFIQLTTLGSNFLLVTSSTSSGIPSHQPQHGGFHVVLKTRTDLILFSLTWSLFTSMMAILVMFLLRAMVTLTHNSLTTSSLMNNMSSSSSSQQQQPQDQSSDGSYSYYYDVHLEHLLSNLECRYVMGALMGVCLAWAVTDIMLGMRGQVIFSLIALVVSLLWCKATIWFFALDKPPTTTMTTTTTNTTAAADQHYYHNKLMVV